MQKSHITRIHHPSGKLYEAFCTFVMGHPEGSFFQSDAFFRLMDRWSEATPVLLIMVDAQHQVQGSLLAVLLGEGRGMQKWLSSRTVVYGGPLMAPQRRLKEHMNVDALFKALIKEVGGRSVYIQFRNFRDWSDLQPVFNSNGFRYEERLNMLVGTSRRIKAWRGLSDSRRRQVRKSLQHGATIVVNPGTDQLRAFYRILHELYAKRVKKPLPSLELFEAFGQMCRAGSYEAPMPDTMRATPLQETGVRDSGLLTGLSGLADAAPELFNTAADTPSGQSSQVAPGDRPGVVMLVTYQGEVVGGIVCAMMPGRAMYEWYVAGLDRQLKGKGIYPSVLVTWSAIEYAAANHLRYFDFMGMGVPDEPYGVRDFNARFGGEWVNHGRFMRVNNKVKYMLAKLGYRAWQAVGI